MREQVSSGWWSVSMRGIINYSLNSKVLRCNLYLRIRFWNIPFTQDRYYYFYRYSFFFASYYCLWVFCPVIP